MVGFIFSVRKAYFTYSGDAILKYSKEDLDAKKSRADGIACNAAVVSILLGIASIGSAHNLSEKVDSLQKEEQEDRKLIEGLYADIHKKVPANKQLHIPKQSHASKEGLLPL